MTSKGCVLLVFAAGMSAPAMMNAQNPTPVARSGVDFHPALSRPAAYPSPAFTLIVFPPGKSYVSIEIPYRLGVFTYAASGRALYTVSATTGRNCINRIDLSPVRVAAAACPLDLDGAFDIAVSAKEDKAFVSGRVQDRPRLQCGIFEVRLPEGAMRPVIVLPSCGSNEDFAHSWTSLSLSPTGDHLVAIRNDVLELLDTENGTSQRIGEGFVRASWSPDGRLIAALTRRNGTTIFDASSWKQRKGLPESTVQWSPDSRSLLRIKWCRFPIAVNGVGTIEILDVNSGKTVAVESSKCSVDSGALGWVSSDVVADGKKIE